jgi:hypothetical protein
MLAHDTDALTTAAINGEPIYTLHNYCSSDTLVDCEAYEMAVATNFGLHTTGALCLCSVGAPSEVWICGSVDKCDAKIC